MHREFVSMLSAQFSSQVSLQVLRALVLGHHRQHPLDRENPLLVRRGALIPLLGLKIFRCKICGISRLKIAI
jgi:hypothetical protein